MLRKQRALGPLGSNIELLVDPSIGIVASVKEVEIEPGAPEFFHYAARACNTSAFCEQRNFHNTGGAAIERETAIAKAVGEAIERYAAAIYAREDFPLTSFRNADFPCIRPGEFALHSADQYAKPGFPWVPFDEDTGIRWTPAIELASGKTVYAPAAFVWIPYVFVRGGGDSPIGQPISTGLAAHGSRSAALLSGLAEVVERDCFTLMWQAMTTPPRLRIETLPDRAYEMVRRFETTGDEAFVFDIRTDNELPCFLSVLRSERRDRPAFVFAAAADLDPAAAIAKSLEELAHTRRYSQQVKRKLPPVSPANEWEDVTNQMDHLNFAADHANAPTIEFLFSSEERREFSDYESLSNGDEAADVDTFVARIARTGYRAYAAELTSEDVKTLGLHVYRVLVPGYHPLFMGHGLRALGGRRLYEVPQSLGFRGIPRGGADNPAPHPYP